MTSAKNAIRASVFVSAVAIALLAADQTAHADDAPAQAETPSPDPGAGAPPNDVPVVTPTTPTTPPFSTPAPDPEPVPADPPPPVVTPVPDGSIDIPPVTRVPVIPSAPGTESDTPTIDGPFPAGTGTTTHQETGVVTDGTAVANTGGNTDTATGIGHNPLDEISVTPGRTSAGVTTGNATGQGSVDHTGISQQVNAIVTENGRVVVVQVAIVVNIGIGLAGSGGNQAASEESALPPRPVSSVGMIVGNESSGAGTGPTPVRINTGTANATGNTGNTQVTQSIVLTGNDVASQLAAVLNIGVGVSNSGLNFALASVSGNNSGTPSSVTFVTMGGGSSIGAGAANALGNRSASAVFQVVTVTASGNGSLLVVQRAIIVNFGLALANSGRNVAGGGSVSAAMPDTGAAQQLLLALLAPGGSGGDAISGVSGSGGGLIGINTGGANAVGNDTTTGIHQQVSGSVTGEQTAQAIQDAWVGNFGLGVANSGYNSANAGLAGIDAASLDAARGALAAFLGGLTGIGDPVQGLDGTFQLGSNLLQLHGDVSGTESLLGITEPGTEITADDASVVVRQVTAVLNIGLALGDSGHNVAVSEAHSTTLGGATTGVGVAVASTTITTGDATSVGNHFATTVCQTIGDAVACAAPDPETPPVVEVPDGDPGPEVHPAVETQPAPQTPAADPFVPPAQPVQAAISTLPFTGSPIGAELAAGSGLLIAGMLLARRRRTEAAR